MKSTKNHATYVGHLRRTFDTRGRQTSILGATPLARRAQKFIDLLVNIGSIRFDGCVLKY